MILLRWSQDRTPQNCEDAILRGTNLSKLQVCDISWRVECRLANLWWQAINTIPVLGGVPGYKLFFKCFFFPSNYSFDSQKPCLMRRYHYWNSVVFLADLYKSADWLMSIQHRPCHFGALEDNFSLLSGWVFVQA